MKPLLFLLPVLALACCGKKMETSAAAEAAPAILLDPYFVATPAPAPQPIHVLRTSAQPGDVVTLSGRVMGRSQLFVADRAAFILGDRAKLTPCNEMPGDSCKTPWDTCCDTPEAKREGTATIQLVDADGRVLKQGLKGVQGLKELSTVTLTGTVAKNSTPEAFVVNATAVHVVP